MDENKADNVSNVKLTEVKHEGLRKDVINHMLLGVADNPLQDMFLDSMLDGIIYPRVVLTIETVRDLKQLNKYRNRSIFDERMILKIIVAKYNKEVDQMLSSLDVQNRLIIVQFPKQSSLEYFYRNYKMRNRDYQKITKLPLAESYAEKKEIITSLIKTWKLAFDSPATKDLLISLLIKNPEYLENAKVSLGIMRENKTMIDLDFLDEVFDGVEQYNLDDWLVNVVRGLKPKKKMEILHYFLNRKEYPPAWLISYIRENLLILNEMYIAYAQGIINHPIPDFQLEKRINHIGFSGGLDLVTLKPKMQEAYLDIVQDVPYSYIVDLNRLVFHKSYNHARKEDIYRLFKEIPLLLEKYGEPKGFQNNRKLKEVIKFNMGKSKKK